MPLPSHFASGRNPPPRTDSLKATNTPYFSELDDELRDTRRVHSQGQEEDLRYALGRTITRVGELVRLCLLYTSAGCLTRSWTPLLQTTKLKEAYRAQTDLQTELTLAKSNLQMALANNEMLEDALKRDPGHSKDIGWRRMSAREQNLKAEADAERRRSTDSLTSTEFSSSPTMSQASPAMEHSPVPRSATMPSPAPSSENRFFKFRFGNGNNAAMTSSHPSSPRLSAGQSPMLNGSHLTSASLPSLVPPRELEKEIEELQRRLEAERKAHKEACDAKVALEGELESLSQALFEEVRVLAKALYRCISYSPVFQANKMVATERMRLAETEEALREAREQGEALKNVLRLFERDNPAGRKRSSVIEPQRGSPTPEPEPHRSRHRASSSAVGIRAPSSGMPSPSSSHPSSPARPSASLPSSAATVTPDPEPSPSVHTTSSHPSAPPSGTEPQPPAPPASLQQHAAPVPQRPGALAPPTNPNLHVATPPTSDSPSPSPSPVVPSPLSGGQFLFAAQRAVNYFDGEESPWADAHSSSPRISS